MVVVEVGSSCNSKITSSDPTLSKTECMFKNLLDFLQLITSSLKLFIVNKVNKLQEFKKVGIRH